MKARSAFGDVWSTCRVHSKVILENMELYLLIKFEKPESQIFQAVELFQTDRFQARVLALRLADRLCS